MAHLNASRSFDRGTYICTRVGNATQIMRATNYLPFQWDRKNSERKQLRGAPTIRGRGMFRGIPRVCARPTSIFLALPAQFIRISPRQFHIRPVRISFPSLLGKYLANSPARRSRFSTGCGLTRRNEANAR